LSASGSELPHFVYVSNLAGLTAEQPVWPLRTAEVARILPARTIARKSAIGPRPDLRRMRSKILDNPDDYQLVLPRPGRPSLNLGAWLDRRIVSKRPRAGPGRGHSCTILDDAVLPDRGHHLALAGTWWPSDHGQWIPERFPGRFQLRVSKFDRLEDWRPIIRSHPVVP
jgi:hypothetical protein